MKEYFVIENGVQRGPFVFAQLEHMWQSGLITADACYSTAGSAEKRPILELFTSADVPGSSTSLEGENEPPPLPANTNFKFSCANCGQHIAASLDQVGTTAPCPNCAKPLIVPRPEDGSHQIRASSSSVEDKSISGSGASGSTDVAKVAKLQKVILCLFVASVVAFFIPYALWITGVLSVIFIYILTKTLRMRLGWLYAVVGLIPVAGLGALLIVNGRATRTLKEQGVSVGFMGARKTKEMRESPAGVASRNSTRAVFSLPRLAALAVVVTVVFLVMHFFSGGSSGPRETVTLTKEEERLAETSNPLVIAPAANVDETLFLLRNLEQMYDNWPDYDPDANALEEKLGQFRNEANRYVAYLGTRNLDPSLTTAYLDLVQAIDSYVDLLAQTGVITRQAQERVNKESFETGLESGWQGGMVAGTLEDQGMKQNDSLAFGAIAGIANFLWTNYNQGKERDAERQREIDLANKNFRDQYSDLRAKTQAIAAALANKYQWATGEAGFDESDQDKAHAQELLSNNDVSTLAQIALDKSRAKPRDPFAKANFLLWTWKLTGQNASADQWLDWASQCLQCAELVPSGSFYDEQRAQFVRLAGYAAIQASYKQLGNSGWKSGPVDSGKLASVYWKTYLQYDPKDEDGNGREQLSYALAAAGNFRDALETSKSVFELRKQDNTYLYGLACLYSLNNDASNALAMLRQSLNLGLTDLNHVKNDPDLSTLRGQLTSDYDDLVKVKYSWDIQYGIFNDDITLTNESAFPLTNITFKPVITNNGNTYNPVLSADYIAPNDTKKWENCVSVAGSHADSKDDSLECGQQ